MARDYVHDPGGDPRRRHGVDVHHGRQGPPEVSTGRYHAHRRPAHHHWRRLGRPRQLGRGVDRRPTQLLRQGSDSEYSWRFWTYDWGTPAAGERTVQSRGVRRRRQRPTRAGRPLPRQPSDLLGGQWPDHSPSACRLTGRAAVRAREGGGDRLTTRSRPGRGRGVGASASTRPEGSAARIPRHVLRPRRRVASPPRAHVAPRDRYD